MKGLAEAPPGMMLIMGVPKSRDPSSSKKLLISVIIFREDDKFLSHKLLQYQAQISLKRPISLSLKAKMKLRHMCKQRDRSVISWGMVLSLSFLVFPGLPSTLIISPWCSFYWDAHILPLIYNSWSWLWLVTWPPLLKGHRRWIFPRHSLGCDLPLMLLVRWSPGCRWLYSWMNRVNEMSTWYLGGYESSVLNFSCWTLDPVILIWVQSLLLGIQTNVSSGVGGGSSSSLV